MTMGIAAALPVATASSKTADGVRQVAEDMATDNAPVYTVVNNLTIKAK